jgi:hypothetical protein
MAEPTVTVRMHLKAKEKLDKIASDDKRSIIDTLDILIDFVIAHRATSKRRTP